MSVKDSLNNLLSTMNTGLRQFGRKNRDPHTGRGQKCVKREKGNGYKAEKDTF